MKTFNSGLQCAECNVACAILSSFEALAQNCYLNPNHSLPNLHSQLSGISPQYLVFPLVLQSHPYLYILALSIIYPHTTAFPLYISVNPLNTPTFKPFELGISTINLHITCTSFPLLFQSPPYLPPHSSPCLNSPNSNDPQWSQNVGRL